jgi:hypothetical protein
VSADHETETEHGMPKRHWIDDLSSALAENRSRRRLLDWSGALAVGLLINAHAEGASAKSKHDDGKDRGGTGGKSRKPKAQGPCAANFHTKHDRKYCKFIQRQCDGDDPRDFCIVQLAPGDDKVAECCFDDRPTCCGRQCCRRNARCCDGRCCGDASSPELQCCHGRCIDTKQDSLHCGECGVECPVGQHCENGRCVCFGGPCEPACPSGLTYCDGECVDTLNDPRHCGGCNAFNPNGLKCCNGNVCTYVDGVCCGGTCYPNGWPGCE